MASLFTSKIGLCQITAPAYGVVFQVNNFNKIPSLQIRKKKSDSCYIDTSFLIYSELVLTPFSSG